MIDGQYLTIQFLFDDLKFSHVDQSVLDSLVGVLNDEFMIAEIMIAETKEHIRDYFGLTIDYSGKDHVEFAMYNYIEDILDEALSDMNGIARITSKSNHFTVHRSPHY